MATHHIPGFMAPDAGDLTCIAIAGRNVAVTVEHGTVYAFDDACTHARCSLSGGVVEGGAVICPCHRSAFDISTGEVRIGPAKIALRCYSAKLLEGMLTVELPEEQGDAAPRPAARSGAGDVRSAHSQ